MFDLKDNEFAGEILQNFDRLDFAACYCSVFNDCWTTSYRTFGESVPVEACTPGDDSFSE